MSGKERGSVSLKKEIKIFHPPSRVIKKAGNNYRLVHISLIMAAGAAEGGLGDGCILHLKSVQLSRNHRKTITGMYTSVAR